MEVMVLHSVLETLEAAADNCQSQHVCASVRVCMCVYEVGFRGGGGCCRA